MHEDRRRARLQALEQRRQPGELAPPRERAGRERDAERARVERRVRVLDAACHSGPERERRAELEHAVVEERQQRRRLLRRKRLEAERGRERDEHALDPVALGEPGAAEGVMVRGTEGRRRLAHELERPAAAVADDARRPPAPRERGHERLGEEVLVDVGAHAGPGY
jgi:hypothetical protein